MAEYKCICCNHIKKSNHECLCPNCGYMMFLHPYHRVKKIAEEILRFYRSVNFTSIDHSELDNEHRKKDGQRFPSFSTIKDFACNSKNTEIFFSRVKTSLDQVKGYIQEPFIKDYKVDYSTLKMSITKKNEWYSKALDVLGMNIEFEEVNFVPALLHYSELPDSDVLPYTLELLEILYRLLDKMQKFVKLNNVYGDAYKRKDEVAFSYSKDNSYQQDIQKIKALLDKTVNTNYVVDFFCDGLDELLEMLKVFWRGFRVLYNLPNLKSKYEYEVNGNLLSADDFYSMLLLEINKQYSDSLDSVSYHQIFNMDEDKLFKVYNELIEIDTYNVFSLDKNNLMKIGESEKKLDQLIGLDSIKTSIQKIKAYAISNKNHNDLNVHMCFYGNPGTGKTEVARVIAGILYENKILPTKKVVEVSRQDLIAAYVGQTPIKTQEVIQRAMGGVLFVDEAYSLVPKNSPGDYGHEAVATLIKAMEDYRGKFCVVLAGYKQEMKELLDTNPGFKSRIQFELDFPNYSREELAKIALLNIKNRGYESEDNVLNKMLDIADVKRKLYAKIHIDDHVWYDFMPDDEDFRKE